MATPILFVAGADPAARRAWLACVEARWRTGWEGAEPLRSIRTSGAGWDALCLAHALTPFAVSAPDPRAAGHTTLLLGDATDPDTLRPLSLDTLNLRLAQDTDFRTRGWPAFLPYGCGIHLMPAGELMASADLMGTFPLVYYATPSVIILTSVPGWLPLWPNFPRALNPRGIVAALMTMHPADNDTAWTAAHRLRVGAVLHWAPGRAVHEIKADRPPPSTICDPDEALHEADRILAALVRAAPAPAGLLLTGGLDSRLVAAMAAREGLTAIAGITLGDTHDQEARIAGQVAASMGWPHRVLPVPLDRLAGWTAAHVARAPLLDSLVAPGMEALETILPDERRPMLSGLYGNSVLADAALAKAWDPSRGMCSFETAFGAAIRWGLDGAWLRRHLRDAAWRNAVSEAKTAFRATFEATHGDHLRQAWWYELLHRQRFHIGRAVNSVARTHWPVPVFNHPAMVRLGNRIPVTITNNRSLQVRLLMRLNPRLAMLPLDRNSADIRPIHMPTPWARVAAGAAYACRRMRLRWQPDALRLYYPRVMSINAAPGWMDLRRLADSRMEVLAPWFDMDAVRRLLPPPPTPINTPDSIRDTAGLKSLIGLTLWLAQPP